MLTKISFTLLSFVVVIFSFSINSFADDEPCIQCHEKISPGQVADWRTSQHFKEGITCSTCHGEEHSNEKDVNLVQLPDEHVCAECHETQFEQFKKGKHNFGWTSLNALPVTHVEPDELMEGGRGCGGCHNMVLKLRHKKRNCELKVIAIKNNYLR